jgi:hypothetical protein
MLLQTGWNSNRAVRTAGSDANEMPQTEGTIAGLSAPWGMSREAVGAGLGRQGSRYFQGWRIQIWERPSKGTTK